MILVPNSVSEKSGLSFFVQALSAADIILFHLNILFFRDAILGRFFDMSAVTW